MKIIFTPVGVSFKDTAPNIDLLKKGSIVSFEHRPAFYGTGDNRKEYPNAVVVLFKGKKVGSLAESSLPESPQHTILKMIKSGNNPKGKVLEIISPTKLDKFKKTYKLSVEVLNIKKTKKEVKGIELKKSFNDENIVIEYNDIEHTYINDKKELTPVTIYIKKFFKKFNVENISKVCAKSWGVDQEKIVNLWKDSGSLASSFGTIVHNTLEFYENNKELGKKISDAKGIEDNYALPKHPILRSIIEGFITINPYKDEKVVCEALVTDLEYNLCGHIDRIVILDWNKKICRVGDYKINIDAEKVSSNNKVLPPFSNLPSNKLSKYQLQMSIYANILQRSGWKVEGLDVYVYEKEWKYTKLSVLQVL